MSDVNVKVGKIVPLAKHFSERKVLAPGQLPVTAAQDSRLETSPAGSQPAALTPRNGGGWRLAVPVVVLAAVAVAVFVSLPAGSRAPRARRPSSASAAPSGPLPVLSAPTTPTEGRATQAFAASNTAILRPLSADMAAIDRDSQGALEGDYGPIRADARRLAADVRSARAAPPPVNPRLASRWSATLAQLKAAAVSLTAAATSADPARIIDALEQMGRAGLALTSFTARE